MKTVIIGLFISLFSILGYAQNEYESKFIRFYLPNNSPIPTFVDSYLSVSNTGKIFLKIRAIDNYNVVECSDFNEYTILKGNNLYLKLDNGNILVLTCSSEKTIKDGFVTTESDIYVNYASYSYFPLDSAALENLRAHNIVKIRGQFKFKVIDGFLQYTPKSEMPDTKNRFTETEVSILKQYEMVKEEKNAQKILKENPLYNF